MVWFSTTLKQLLNLTPVQTILWPPGSLYRMWPGSNMKLWSLDLYQHNEIIKPFVSFQLSKLSYHPAYLDEICASCWLVCWFQLLHGAIAKTYFSFDVIFTDLVFVYHTSKVDIKFVYLLQGFAIYHYVHPFFSLCQLWLRPLTIIVSSHFFFCIHLLLWPEALSLLWNSTMTMSSTKRMLNCHWT